MDIKINEIATWLPFLVSLLGIVGGIIYYTLNQVVGEAVLCIAFLVAYGFAVGIIVLVAIEYKKTVRKTTQ